VKAAHSSAQVQQISMVGGRAWSSHKTDCEVQTQMASVAFNMMKLETLSTAHGDNFTFRLPHYNPR
jgi:hypothetical protein